MSEPMCEKPGCMSPRVRRMCGRSQQTMVRRLCMSHGEYGVFCARCIAKAREKRNNYEHGHDEAGRWRGGPVYKF